MVGWLVFNGTFSTNGLYYAMNVTNLVSRLGKKHSNTNKTKQTRNSAIADKPCDAFVQMQWRG